MSQYPPNNGQPPNWQGQPWQGVHPPYMQPQSYQQPGQWDASPYTQPRQTWQPVPPPASPAFRGKPPKKQMTKKNKIIGVGCLGVILLLLCGVIGAIATVANANNGTTAAPTTIVAVPSDTPTTINVQAVLPTDTSTTAAAPTPTPKPTPRPTATPTQNVVRPTPTQGHTGINGNPWGYDFNPGNYIDPPPTGFCNYFNCIATFYASDDPGDGWIVQCVDGTYSQSGGERGACSGHGGESRPLFSH